MSRIEIHTIDQAKAAVKSARLVMVQPRFGVSEQWVKIAKVEALEFLSMHEGASAKEMEMFSGSFGELNGNVLYLG